MFDNGLLKYYKTSNNDQGFVNYKDCDMQMRYRTEKDSIRVCFSNQGKFFEKSYDVLTKKRIDAEVLLSQVYAKAGFKTAIYTPIKDFFCKDSISKDVSTTTSLIASDFFSSIKDNAIKMPLSKKEDCVFLNYFSKNGMREYLKMQLFDTASFNADRHEDNYIVQLSEDNKIDSLLLYDYDSSAFVYNRSILKPDFFNCFEGSILKSREQMIYQFKNNEYAQDYVTPSELAESIGSIDVIDVAKDIKQTIDYSVSKKFVDNIAKSYENMAEELIK